MKRVPQAIEINDVFGAETQLVIVSLSILPSKCTWKFHEPLLYGPVAPQHQTGQRWVAPAIAWCAKPLVSRSTDHLFFPWPACESARDHQRQFNNGQTDTPSNGGGCFDKWTMQWHRKRVCRAVNIYTEYNVTQLNAKDGVGILHKIWSFQDSPFIIRWCIGYCMQSIYPSTCYNSSSGCV